MEVEEELVDDLVAFIEALPLLFLEVPGDGYLEVVGSEFEVHDDFVEIDEIALELLGMEIIKDDLLFGFAHADHGGLEHFEEELFLLGVDRLVEGVFEFFVDFDVFYVELGVVLKPLVVVPLVVHPEHRLVLLQRQVLVLHLLHQVVYRFLPFVVVILVRHNLDLIFSS